MRETRAAACGRHIEARYAFVGIIVAFFILYFLSGCSQQASGDDRVYDAEFKDHVVGASVWMCLSAYMKSASGNQ